MGERRLPTHVRHVTGSPTETSDVLDGDTPFFRRQRAGTHEDLYRSHDADKTNAPTVDSHNNTNFPSDSPGYTGTKV